MSLSVFPFKPKNLVRQEATPSQKDLWKQIIRYGDCDDFPLRLARLVQNSPTGTSCLDTKSKFLEGSGFSDVTLADMKMNVRGDRLGDIHSLNSESFATFEGFALNVKYNLNADITEIYSIPFEYCRLGIPDKFGVISQIHVNPYFGTAEYLPHYGKVYNAYNPNKAAVLAQQDRDGKKYLGQILYVATTGPLSRFYPAPKYYSAEHWLAIDEAIGGFHHKNIDNNFLQSLLMTVIGDEAAPSTHPDDMIWNATTNNYDPDPSKTNGYRWNIEMQKFQGWENAGNLMTFWARAKGEEPVLTQFPSTSNADLFKILQDITTEQIARATKVPSVLANIQSGASLGGDGNNIRASVKLMQAGVQKDQAMMERTYKDLLSRMVNPYLKPITILNYTPFREESSKTIDVNIWGALTLEEKRNWIKNNTEYQLLVEHPTTIQPDHPPIPIDPPPAQQIGIQNKFFDISYTNYPSGAKETAQKAKDFRDKTASKCGGRAGWEMNQNIIDGNALSYKLIRRIYNYLNKNQEFANNIFSDSCEAVLFSAWGGKEMLKWAGDIINSINE